jgi:hypothetical protein
LLQRGDVSAANGAFRRALELNAADVESCWGMALTQALLGDGDGEGALRLAARAHERATQYP